MCEKKQYQKKKERINFVRIKVKLEMPLKLY